MLKFVSHTGVGVADLNKALELYETMGFRVTRRFEKPELKASVAWVEKAGTALELWQFDDYAHSQV